METIDIAALPPKKVLLVTADEQTAGRGQRGTQWESETARNLTFSFAFRPERLRANAQFLLSEITSLAVARTLGTFTDDITIKWPNDVYYRNRKIGGMLLEHTLCGTEIAATLVGIGININQTTFFSDAPNPVSLRQILGQNISRTEVLTAFVLHFEKLYEQWRKGQTAAIEKAYHAALYRRKGFYAYRDTTTDELFSAEIVTIAPNGLITLRTTEGAIRTFAFKEIRFMP